MHFIVTCFLLITGSWAMDREVDEEENIPLLCDLSFEQNSFEYLNDSSFPPSDLPDDLFWPVVFDCKDSIVSLSAVSKALYKRIGELIPTIALPRFPSSRNILDVLSIIEKCELKYISLRKLTIGMTYFPKYQKEIERLCACEPYVRYSPLFWWYNGSDRTKKIHSIHNLEPAETSEESIDKLRRYCSSIMRDPIILGIASAMTLTLTGIISWHMNIMNNQYELAFQKNLNYTYSPEFLQEYRHFSRYNCLAENHHFGCFNVSHYCLEGNSPLSNVTGLSEMMWKMIPTTFLPFNLNILSVHEIENIVIDSLNKKCSIDRDTAGWREYIYRIIANNTTIIENTIKNSEETSWYCQDMYKIGPNMAYFIPRITNYDPLCIAKSMTLMPTGLPVWGTVTIVLNIIFWGMFLLGWGISL